MRRIPTSRGRLCSVLFVQIVLLKWTSGYSQAGIFPRLLSRGGLEAAVLSDTHVEIKEPPATHPMALVSRFLHLEVHEYLYGIYVFVVRMYTEFLASLCKYT